MASQLDPVLMAQLARRLEEHMGWSMGEGSQRHVEHALRNMARQQGFHNTAECLAWLAGGPWDEEKADACAWFLTVGETYFFREKRGFDLITACMRERLADPARAGQPLRIWSAGCCTGEEPYSVAMTLLEAFPGVSPRDVSILATDVSKRNLELAQAGEYRKWSFRGRGAHFRERYFTETPEGSLRIGDKPRRMVRFGELNLALPGYPSPANGTSNLDIILCRNVLMYFTPEQRRRVVQRFRSCLVDGGWLVVNASEASSELFEGFESTCYADAIHYRKASAAARRAPAHVPVAPLPPPPEVATCRAPRPAQEARKPAGAPRPPTAPVARQRPATQARPVADAGDTQVAELRARVLHAMEVGDTDRARAGLQRIIFLEPLDVAAHYLLGMVLAESGKGEQAQRKFAVAAELLASAPDDEIVPGTDGLPAGYLRSSLRTLLSKGANA